MARDLRYEPLPRGGVRHLDTVTILFGALVVIAGMFALVYAFYATAYAILVSAIALLIAGFARIVDAVVHRRSRELGHGILTGVLHAVVGGLMLWRPDVTMLAVTLLIGALFFAGGIGRTAMALSTRHIGWGWSLFSGLLSVGLGLYIAFTWPVSSLWLIGTLVGVELLNTGFALLASGFYLHRAERRIEEVFATA
ncbi:MAG: HdeD family acid-resistance protein [Polyangiaceae bacterium]|nr:HdeD family acid-resistance protein [Polyangiaceae bacterium]